MITVRGTVTVMTDALTTLAAWFSPAFPIGAFSYAHGLETAVRNGIVIDRASLSDWIGNCVAQGAGRSDVVLMATAYRDPQDNDVADLAAALQPSLERHLESTAQGTAFTEAVAEGWDVPVAGPAPYPVAVGRAAAAAKLPLPETATMYLFAFAANLVSAGIRLIPLGQTDGQKVIAALQPLCHEVADAAIAADPDDIGAASLAADIASMRHETLAPRLFRS